MLNFICRRLAHSCLVILGVMLLTFVLFQMAAGDPATAVLGKNPKPLEIENLRRELKSDLPMFYGHWRKSEVYSAADYEKKFVELPGIEVSRDFVKTRSGVQAVKFVFKRKFEVQEKILIKVGGRGYLTVDGVGGRGYLSVDGKSYYFIGDDDIVLDKAPEQLEITDANLRKLSFSAIRITLSTVNLSILCAKWWISRVLSLI